MVIKVLGKGCKNCDKLQKVATEAADALELDYTIEKVTDINKISDYGVFQTPALVVDEKVVSQGKIPSLSQVKKLLKA